MVEIKGLRFETFAFGLTKYSLNKNFKLSEGAKYVHLNNKNGSFECFI